MLITWDAISFILILCNHEALVYHDQFTHAYRTLKIELNSQTTSTIFHQFEFNYFPANVGVLCVMELIFLEQKEKKLISKIVP